MDGRNFGVRLRVCREDVRGVHAGACGRGLVNADVRALLNVGPLIVMMVPYVLSLVSLSAISEYFQNSLSIRVPVVHVEEAFCGGRERAKLDALH